MPLPSQDPKPMGLAVKMGDTAFADFMSKTIIDWDKTGYIIMLEKKYGAKPSSYVAAQHKKYM